MYYRVYMLHFIVHVTTCINHLESTFMLENIHVYIALLKI